MESIRKLNPQIKNPDLIKVGDRIVLTPIADTSKKIELVCKDQTAKNTPLKKANYVDDRWTVGASYGAHYLSYSQSGGDGQC